MSTQDSTTIFIGNLKTTARIGDLKISLYRLIKTILKIQITQKDINIINGSKRYALIDVHYQQNVDFLLHKLKAFGDRQHVDFNFLSIVDKGTDLYVDTVKSQDEKQARDDYENAKNLYPFRRPHRHLRLQRSDLGKPVSLKSVRSLPSSSSRADDHRAQSVSYTSSDLDVTLEEDEDGDAPTALASSTQVKLESNGEVMNRPVEMITVGNSTLREEEDGNEGASNMLLGSPITSDRNDSQNSHYEDPPGSVIDLRHVSRASFNSKVTPRIHRRKPNRDLATSRSESRQDFFEFLDRQIGIESETSEPNRLTTLSGEARLAEELRTPYYKEGERVLNLDLSKEFKAYTHVAYSIRQVRDYMVKCVCGYLNSGQNGTLLIGVQTDGLVVGIECDRQQEDRFQQHFQEGIKEIYPPVFTEDYDINFSPLLQDNGRQHHDRKVIEVRVRPPENPDILYECKEGVFVRRKGVLTGPIRPSHIQEWIKQKHFAELTEMHQEETNMKDELDRKDMMIRRQADTIVSQKSEIERQQQIIDESKSCTIL